MRGNDTSQNVSRFLTSEETVELARLQQDNSVLGYCLLSMEGEEITSTGLWHDLIAPIFANVVDLADRVGEEFGEQESCSRLTIENKTFEVTSVTLSACRAIVVKRKQPRKTEGLRSVS
ncbi:MAG: roadblock/LC7 domain-containing protein [Pseudomonadota bacterium]